MKRYLLIHLYGATIILAGVFLLFSHYTTFHVMKLALGTMLTLGALLAIWAAFSRRRKQVQFAYHEMHALTMLVYGISILLFGSNLEKVLNYTSFALMFYSLSEIIFCNWLFNLGEKIVYKILAIRLILGLAIGIGTILAFDFSKHSLEIFGVLFVLIGFNILLYVPVMKGIQSKNMSNEASE
jgi:uncharacterized membrane protein HdeD (DUF308 family)